MCLSVISFGTPDTALLSVLAGVTHHNEKPDKLVKSGNDLFMNSCSPAYKELLHINPDFKCEYNHEVF